MSRDPFEQKIFDALEVAFWGQDLDSATRAAEVGTVAVMEAVRFALINRDKRIERDRQTLGLILAALQEGGLVENVRT